MSLNLRALYRQTVVSGSRTVYVAAATGSDSNNGTSTALAYATITAAINNAQAGDRILVDAGTYAYLNIYGKNGSPAKWISIESLNDAVRPVISVADNSGNDGVDIQLSSYLGLFGFEVVGLQTSTNTNPSGIGIFRASTRIVIWNNLVHDFPGGGINCFYVASSTYNGNTLPAGSWDLVDISFNTIHDTSKYSPYNTSGISFYGAIDSTTTTWDGRYGYKAVGNYIYNVICTVPYTPGGYNFVTDGNGISCDSLNTANNLAPGIPSYTKFGLLESNLVVGCGGRAVHTYNTINVDDFYGTYIGNLRTNSQAINNGVETDAQYDSAPAGGNGVTHIGCVIVPLNTPNTTDGISTYSNCVIAGGTQSVPNGNINKVSVGASYLSGSPTMVSVLSPQSTTFYTPVTVDTATKPAHSQGYQALGNGPRGKAAWTIGALDSTAAPLYFPAKNSNPAVQTFDTGANLSSWTIGAGSPSSDASLGNGSPSYLVPGNSYMYRNLTLAKSIYQTDIYVGGGSLVDFFFGASSTGAGYMARLDGRGANAISGLATTSSWTAWNSPSTGIDGSNITTSSWHTLKITISGGTASLTIDNVAAGSMPYTSKGSYIGLVGDGLGGGHFDNIAIT